MKYKVIKKEIAFLESMEDEINEHLKNGWELYGSPCTSVGGVGVGNCFIQALKKS